MLLIEPEFGEHAFQGLLLQRLSSFPHQ
jgi:hypothetical protein